MIIFTHIKDMPIELLEYKGISVIEKLNLTSYYADIPYLGNLNPSIEYIPESILNGDCADPNFDIAYHEYIFNNDAAFIQFMSIIVPEYMNPDVLVQILIERSEYRDVIVESLMKLIQQRYGNNCYLIQTEEDFAYTERQSFSIPGLFTLDKDISRWQMLVGRSEDFVDA